MTGLAVLGPPMVEPAVMGLAVMGLCVVGLCVVALVVLMLVVAEMPGPQGFRAAGRRGRRGRLASPRRTDRPARVDRAGGLTDGR